MPLDKDVDDGGSYRSAHPSSHQVPLIREDDKDAVVGYVDLRILSALCRSIRRIRELRAYAGPPLRRRRTSTSPRFSAGSGAATSIWQ